MDLQAIIALLEELPKLADDLLKMQDALKSLTDMSIAQIDDELKGRTYICLPDFLNMQELCSWFNLSHTSMKKIVDIEDFPKIPIGVGGDFRFPKQAVLEWVKANATDKKIKKLLGRIA